VYGSIDSRTVAVYSAVDENGSGAGNVCRRRWRGGRLGEGEAAGVFRAAINLEGPTAPRLHGA